MTAEQLKFTKTHEWIEPEGKVRKVGISDFAQHQLGDIVYVEFPAGGKSLQAGEEACVIESCKATSGIYAPLPGKIVRFNDALGNAPETVNQSPYDEGWLFELEVAPGADESGLLSHADYEAVCAAE
jgi:glycine cleavage system H protein